MCFCIVSGTYTEVPAQKIVNTNESGTIPFTYSEIHMDARNNLIATLASTEQTNAYVFKSFDSTWSLQQKLQAFEPNAPLNDTSLLLPYANNATLEDIRSDMNTSVSTNCENSKVLFLLLMFHCSFKNKVVNRSLGRSI